MGNQKSFIVEDNKPVYTSDIIYSLPNDTARYRLYCWLNNTFLPQRGYIVSKMSTKSKIVCQVIDLQSISKGYWSSFSMYVRYKLLIDLSSQGHCVVKVYDISYLEPEKMSSLGKFSDIDIIPGDMVLISKKFKASLFVKNASEQILNYTDSNMQHLFEEISGVITN